MRLVDSVIVSSSDHLASCQPSSAVCHPCSFRPNTTKSQQEPQPSRFAVGNRISSFVAAFLDLVNLISGPLVDKIRQPTQGWLSFKHAVMHVLEPYWRLQWSGMRP